MKIRFNCDSGANIKSNKQSKWLDPVEDLGFGEGEWNMMTDDEKEEEANLWAWDNGLSIYYEEKA